MAVIRKENPIIKELKEALGIDKIPNLKDFSIHVKQNSEIEVEIHAYNDEFQLEKIVKIFKSTPTLGHINMEVDGSPAEIVERVRSKDTRLTGPDPKQIRRQIFHERIYDTVYCLDSVSNLDEEGLTIKCSGDFIRTWAPPDPSYINNDLILENLKGIKEIITFVPIQKEPEFPPNEILREG